MATINTSHAKARIIVNMLLECGVSFGYAKDLQNASPDHQDVIEVSDGRRELLRECLYLATERLEREREAISRHQQPRVTRSKA